MLEGVLRGASHGILIDVDVRPGASATRIAGVHEARRALRVDVAARPGRGEANRELSAFFARLAGRGSVVTIVRGASARRKTLLIVGVSRDALAAALAQGMR